MVRLEKVAKTYRGRKGDVEALRDVDLQVARGEVLALRGPSGSGKTTLLLILGGMLRPTRGTVRVDGRELGALRSGDLAEFRRERIGFVFQLFHLVPYLDVLGNVLLAGEGGGGERRRAADLLERLGLSSRIAGRPAELSAGEKQRVALARALLNRPPLVLADEPTGNLDPPNAAEVFRVLGEYRKEGGTVIVATHGPSADLGADREVRLEAGRIVPAMPL
jgi:putative ABC transport system ATP-binding protein